MATNNFPDFTAILFNIEDEIMPSLLDQSVYSLCFYILECKKNMLYILPKYLPYPYP